MHANNFKPNILQDKIAAANGRDLRSRRGGDGALTAKRWREPRRVYPYSSERQNTRVVRKAKRKGIEL